MVCTLRASVGYSGYKKQFHSASSALVLHSTLGLLSSRYVGLGFQHQAFSIFAERGLGHTSSPGTVSQLREKDEAENGMEWCGWSIELGRYIGAFTPFA